MNITHNNVKLNQTTFRAQINTNTVKTQKVLPSQDLFFKSTKMEPQVTTKQVNFTGNKLRELEITMIFKPTNKLLPIKPELKDKIEEVKIKSTDDLTLNCWYIKPEENKPTILFTHGNKKNITQKQDVAGFLAKNGYGVLMAEYRGYGGNPGTPTEQGLYDDATAALKFLNEEKGIPTEDLYLWGHSLGGGIASELASKNQFKGVILDSTFTNIVDMTKETILRIIESKNLPMKNALSKMVKSLPDKTFSFIHPKFNNISKVDKIDSPLLFLHSKTDIVIPYQMSEQLASKAKGSKLVLSEKGLHSDHEWSEKVKKEFFDQD